MNLYEQETSMSSHNRPRPGRGWRPPDPGSSHRLADLRPGRYATGAPAYVAPLMADLEALVSLGLVMPVRDGQTIRLAINPDAEGDPYE
jgi:hypothetical protein